MNLEGSFYRRAFQLNLEPITEEDRPDVFGPKDKTTLNVTRTISATRRQLDLDEDFMREWGFQI